MVTDYELEDLLLAAIYKRARGVRGIGVEHLKRTKDCGTVELVCGSTVRIPLAMHIGAAAECVVAKGDRVCVGTLIGRATSFVSANIHSSVSGTVKEIGSILGADGVHRPMVVIENDGLFTVSPDVKPPVVTNRNELVEAIRASGLVGLGGAGFPTHVKLAPPKNSVIDTLVVNAAECEPYITSDYREMMEFPDSVADGLVTVMGLLSIKQAFIGVEDNKPDAIALMKKLMKNISNVKVVSLKSRYPQGAEKMLIANTVHRAVPVGKLPSDVGCIVLNVGSLSFIAKYLKTGMPLVNRRITVDGSAVAKPGNYFVPVGMSIADIIEQCGGYKAPCRRLLMGGPMMGIAQYTDDYPILKNNNAILALTEQDVCGDKQSPCIHCGRCAEGCPMRLSPVEIALAFDGGDLSRAEALSVMACVECGSCSYRCPAKRHVTQTMKLAKIAIRKAKTL